MIAPRIARVGSALIAEHSYFWVGVETVTRPEGGTVTTGEHMYVEYFVPAEPRHERPIVFVHGGGGQSIAFLGMGDGRPGWLHHALARGYTVYLLDRPGYGRNPPNPRFIGTEPAPFEALVPLFLVGAQSGRWPGSGQADDPAVAAFMAQQRPMRFDTGEYQQEVSRRRGAELLDRIGAAIVITHSAGGPFGWLLADSRPELVSALVSVEGLGPAALPSPLTYDPPASSIAELGLEPLPDEPGVDWGALAAVPRLAPPSPPRRLAQLSRVPIAVVTSDDPRFAVLNRDTIAFLRAAGCTVEDLVLADRGIHGNSHMMSLEENNGEVLDVILDWVEGAVA